MKNNKGIVISIEGVDGTGKSTQVEMLKNHFQENGIVCNTRKYPSTSDKKSSTLVHMYLSGEMGDVYDVNAYGASSFYACDRYIDYLLNWKKFYDRGELMIMDRYTPSNLIHQATKLPKEDWDEYVAWQTDYEYNKLGIPTPDMVIYLSLNADTSQQLLSKRYSLDESKKDIHEKNKDYLQKCIVASDYIADKLNWEKINCDNESFDGILSKEDIHKKIIKKIREARLF